MQTRGCLAAIWAVLAMTACDGGAGGDVHAAERATAESPGRGLFDDVLRRDVTFDRATLQQRLTRRGDGGTDPEAACLFADFDGDGRDECAAVLGDGWWGRRWHLAFYGAVDGGWRLGSLQSYEEPNRGCPGLGVESHAGVTWLQVRRNAGWGTGYSCGETLWFAAERGQLRELLRAVTHGEQCHAQLGVEFGMGDLVVTTDAAGQRIAAEITVEAFLDPAFDGLPSSLEWRVPVSWRRQPGEVRFVTDAILDKSLHNRFFAEGARRWLAEHGAAIRKQAASGSDAQRRTLTWLEQVAAG